MLKLFQDNLSGHTGESGKNGQYYQEQAKYVWSERKQINCVMLA